MVSNKGLWVVVFFLLSSLSNSVVAQVEVGAGIDFGFPLMFNSKVKGHNHALGSPGANAILSYTPKGASFTGTVKVGVSRLMLPVERFNPQDVLYMNFTSTNISLLGRFCKQLTNDAILLFGPGVGVNVIKGSSVQVSRSSENKILNILEDSTVYNKTTVPSFYLNMEYMKPVKAGSRWFYGFGVQLHYIYFLDQGTTYRVDVIDEKYNYYSLEPELKGHMLNPVLFANLYYRL